MVMYLNLDGGKTYSHQVVQTTNFPRTEMDLLLKIYSNNRKELKAQKQPMEQDVTTCLMKDN